MDNRTIRFSEIVSRDSMEWGHNVAETYHIPSVAALNISWAEFIWPMLSRLGVDLAVVMDFACGYGRNARKLREAGAGEIVLVDVNQENLDYCNEHLVPLGGYKTFRNNGFDLTGIDSDKFTHVYSFDAMVHFDLEIVLSYIAEFKRVLKPGGTAFIHHSNFYGNPGASFRTNPNYRNFMSADIFKHVALRNGLEVVEQKAIAWGVRDDTDCITTMRLPL